MREGDLIENAIVIKNQDYISGVLEEHKYIDKICNEFDSEIQSIDQNLVIDNGKKYDVFTLKMDDNSKRQVYFDITSFFISWPASVLYCLSFHLELR